VTKIWKEIKSIHP